MERPKSWMTSGAFARLCGTTKETLRHYKDTGLLPPAHQGENGYFYYDLEQFYDFLAIVIFRQTGTPLEEIRRCMESQTPQGTLALLREQRRRLEEERQRLEELTRGAAAESASEKTFLEQASQARRLLERVVDLDRRISLRMAGDQSFYKK